MFFSILEKPVVVRAVPESELPAHILERLNETRIREKADKIRDPFEGHRISAEEVPEDIRRQARKDKKR